MNTRSCFCDNGDGEGEGSAARYQSREWKTNEESEGRSQAATESEMVETRRALSLTFFGELEACSQ